MRYAYVKLMVHGQAEWVVVYQDSQPHCSTIDEWYAVDGLKTFVSKEAAESFRKQFLN